MVLRLALKVAYYNINSQFHGFQIQPNVDTIFSFLQKALQNSDFLSENDEKIDYAGRTDHGVNAVCQVIAFNLNGKWAEVPDRLLYRINVHLPQNIRCWSYARVKNDFHPRYDALERDYMYIYTMKEDDYLDVQLMTEASRMIQGKHDFTNFSKNDIDIENYEREITEIRIEKLEKQIFISIKARSFLWQQCRRIGSHLIQIGKGQVSLDYTTRLLTMVKTVTKPTPLPPENLILTNISYKNVTFHDENAIKLKIIQTLNYELHENETKMNTLAFFSTLFQ